MAPLGARRLVAGQVAVPYPGEVVIAAICSFSCWLPAPESRPPGCDSRPGLVGQGILPMRRPRRATVAAPTNACSGIQSEQVFDVKDFVEQVFAPNT
jgi:hypothetical protein